jgi:hypothetical protein
MPAKFGYAVKTDGSYRTVWDNSTLENDEVFQENPPEVSYEQLTAKLLSEMEGVVEALLDRTAQERKYSNRLSICGYVNSPNEKWKAEAEAFIAWRDLELWPTCYGIMNAVQAQQRPVPTADELLAELPPMAWPA